MKALSKWVISMIIAAAAIIPILSVHASSESVFSGLIDNWQMKYTAEEAAASWISPDEVDAQGGWIHAGMNVSSTVRPQGVTTMWIKLELPSIGEQRALYLEELYAQKVEVYMDGNRMFQSERLHGVDLNRILLPLKESDSGRTLLIQLESTTESLGISSGALIGDYHELANAHVKKDLFDIILGSALIFSAVVMIVSSLFLEKCQLKSWIPLCLVILSIGGIMTFYSPFLYTFYGDYGELFQFMLDIATIILLPAFMYFFENVFGKGIFGIVRMFRIVLLVYSGISLICSILNVALDNEFFDIYRFFSVSVAGFVMTAQLIIIMLSTGMYIMQRKRDYILLSCGFGIFASIAAGELIWYYTSSEAYKLYLWKWGLIAFLLTLILLLGRRYACHNALVVQYSKELELYNQELQLSEKREIISQLAASVAHEVRNPLQVTRGFLQLLEEKNTDDQKRASYLDMAIKELDRASTIITNFLTYAKPQMEDTKVLNLSEELKHVENVIVPLANLHGSVINIDIPDHLHVYGNSSKLKQAFINLIKNSIEALMRGGNIRLWAYGHKGEVIIHIADDGEGMEADVLARIGQPYFTSKPKGTGLGLMVTYRIIEALQGSIVFKSEKGIGTEAIIRLPATAIEENGE